MTDMISPRPAAPPRQRNRRGEGGRLRDEIIAAAMRILDTAPASELSLRMIAREVGVAAPSVYSHFKDARALMAEIVRDCWAQLGGEMSEAAAQCTAGALATLKVQMAAYVRYAMERPSRYQLLFALQPLETEALRDLPGLIQPAYRNVSDSIERFAAEGHVLPTVDVVDATLLTLAMAHGRIALAHTAPHRAGNATAGVEQFVLDMLDRIFRV
ncbi:TetR/AcrR family transcriptional regulator [Sphingomonas solaris]|nr:TetR/AcrR family transcriptional regulator [Sphingomonas solaris]